ncbi:MAG TPA: DUF167 family protein [Gammaproteobacteria bacterium]|nr:DUF167 family protein [Gammaproteobacteria bacterium]
MGTWYRWRGETLELSVRIQPRASRDEIVGPQGERLKVRITAPPVEGRANEHLIRFLAKAFAVPARQVELLAGATGRNKRLAIHGPTSLPAGIARRPRGPSSD